MADGRTQKEWAEDYALRVSILARPWRTGALPPLPLTDAPPKFQSSPVHGGRAHESVRMRGVSEFQVSILARPWRTGARGCLHPFYRQPRVSILARPWRTGARFRFPESRQSRGCFNPRPSMADGRTVQERSGINDARCFNPRPSMADGRTNDAWSIGLQTISFNPRPSMADGRTFLAPREISHY